MYKSNKEKSLEKVKKVYSFWGKFPSLYSAQDLFTFLGKAGTIRRYAVDALGLKNGDKVLEVACGSGRNFRYLINAVGKEGKITGFDYSQEMLNAASGLCKRKSWGNITLVHGDAAVLGVEEKNFDAVLSVLGISAVPEWEKALQRCREVLKKGGRLVVCDARLFTGIFRALNPLIKLIYSTFAAWDPSKDIPGKMKEIFGNAEVKAFNMGTFFIARSVKHKE
ncbi:MAG: methyltransferase domain-containing protein [Deltaproteobacteria bacterium]|nr:methyltransferase domain-containing protein [Deltaproteobacteria bacterium]